MSYEINRQLWEKKIEPYIKEMEEICEAYITRTELYKNRSLSYHRLEFWKFTDAGMVFLVNFYNYPDSSQDEITVPLDVCQSKKSLDAWVAERSSKKKRIKDLEDELAALKKEVQ